MLLEIRTLTPVLVGMAIIQYIGAKRGRFYCSRSFEGCVRLYLGDTSSESALRSIYSKVDI